MYVIDLCWTPVLFLFLPHLDQMTHFFLYLYENMCVRGEAETANSVESTRHARQLACCQHATEATPATAHTQGVRFLNE